MRAILNIMIELFYTSIENQPCAPALACWQREKAAAYKRREDRLRCIAASLLINAVLFDGMPAPPPLLGEYKKPYYVGKPEFNLSHAGEYAVLAVAPVPVGIDLEQMHAENFLSLGKSFLCKSEYRLLEQSSDRHALFYDLWTRKESYLKMTGTGLLKDPTLVRVLPAPAGYHFHTPAFFPGYRAVVCSADTQCAGAFSFIRL